jgi:hypothetical protein
MEQSTRSRGRRVVATALAASTIGAAAVAATLSGSVLASSAGPSVAGQYGPSKIIICHHARGKKGTKHVSIRISRSALRAHQRHGDSLGRCTTAKNKKLHKKNKTHARKFHKRARR